MSTLTPAKLNTNDAVTDRSQHCAYMPADCPLTNEVQQQLAGQPFGGQHNRLEKPYQVPAHE